MNAKRNEAVEREMVVSVATKELDKMLLDRRNGLRMGTLRQMCQQFGISIKTNGNTTILRAKRDGMQMTVEKLHFCRIQYLLMP